MSQQPKKNLWKPDEDLILRKYVETHGEGNWATVSQETGTRFESKAISNNRYKTRAQSFLYLILFIFLIILQLRQS